MTDTKMESFHLVNKEIIEDLEVMLGFVRTMDQMYEKLDITEFLNACGRSLERVATLYSESVARLQAIREEHAKQSRSN